jgi:organic radical activating enzyme
MRSPEDLMGDVWSKYDDTGATAINLTGGEPFQQPERLLEQFVMRAIKDFEIECFSNGSFIYPQWALDNINFVMDWKLEGSGEAATKRDERTVNAHRLKPSDAIKFVVTGVSDLHEARETWQWLRNDTPAEFWCGPAWGLYGAADIVEYIKTYTLPWNLNVQVHNYVYNPQERGR